MPAQSDITRPLIFDYESLPLFIKNVLNWRKKTEPGFSIRRETQGVRRCSATLVSHIVHGKRKLTPERVDAISRLLKLTAREKAYLAERVAAEAGFSAFPQKTRRNRRERSAKKGRTIC